MASKTKIKKGKVVGKKKKITGKKEVENRVTKVVKRSGKVVAFDEAKIAKAVKKAFAETKEGAEKEAVRVANKVAQLLN